MKINEKEIMNALNIKVEYNISDDENVYKCVLCDNECSLSTSTSLKGSHLMCVDCVYSKFNGRYYLARKWQLGEKYE